MLDACIQMGGAGRRLDPTLVADAIGALLAEPRYADSARATGQKLARLPGAAGAAGIIEALLQPATDGR